MTPVGGGALGLMGRPVVRPGASARPDARASCPVSPEGGESALNIGLSVFGARFGALR